MGVADFEGGRESGPRCTYNQVDLQYIHRKSFFLSLSPPPLFLTGLLYVTALAILELKLKSVGQASSERSLPAFAFQLLRLKECAIIPA